MPPLLRVVLAASLCTLAAHLAHAAEAPPAQLTIGYDGEGKANPSIQSCTAFVKEVTEWNQADTERGAKEVCAARKRHVDAYRALQTNYKAFIKAFGEDRRLNLADAVAQLRVLTKACIDHKFGLTTGGHNIAIETIQNDIDAACLTLSANLIRDETGTYTKR